MFLQVNGISKSYGITPVFSNITLQILDRIGLVGVNGAGKSTLLQLSPDSGTIYKFKETRLPGPEQRTAIRPLHPGRNDSERAVRAVESA